ncbi:MAG: deoxyribose-phosphate aldolase [Chitinophagaceae bacterium]|nr:deoxyribose-phosphate aldolase [Chitinophagaceae bacterium]
MSINITKGADISPFIDHTALKPGLLLKDVEKLCGEAKTYGFAAVCIPPLFVKVEAKIAEILLAMVDGADELDVVINFTAIKNNDWQLVANEINHIMPIVKSKGKIIKTIIESGVLTDEEIIRCCDIYGAAGIDFMKTSTGYADKGASVEAVKLMRKHLPESISIKASGGIRTFEFARELIAAGATRLGCSSSIAIVQEKTAEGNY